MSIPILDLKRARQRIASELEERWARILDENSYVLGPEVREFEKAFAEFLELPASVAVGNGTDGLILALRALDLKPGDEVIVPAFSFFATAEAVLWLGGTPVFADVDPETLNLDPADAEARVTGRTVGIIGVHLYGRPFDVDAILALCAKRGLWLIEDAAQAHGARWKGKRVGGFGRLAAWSFYPTKNLGCFGDGGAVTGGDADLVDKVRLLANHGQTSRYHHVLVGVNSRLDSLQAAVLNCRIKKLDQDNARRRDLAGRYQSGLSRTGDIRFPPDREGVTSVYHQLTLRTEKRDALMEHLKSRGIASAVHYPSTLDRQPAMEGLVSVPEGDLPVATAAAREVLCLPMYPELADREVDEVCEGVRSFYG
ncbi:MAG TPA: DegT/DnrJ/EryC1/StrS family aminotransferase [Thermoanaerobaculia bacterium]|nr:DegT/DnrJ/EryC1/StrS family aminotransferase [Thermoanaerobaculia bacterium]